MNSTPAASRARRIAKSFAVVSEVSLSFNSARRIVATLRADAVASSSAVHGKFEAVSDFIAWVADNNPNLNIIYASHSETRQPGEQKSALRTVLTG
jgi:hypothetical protein